MATTELESLSAAPPTLYDVVQMTDRPDAARATFDLNGKGQLAFGELDETGQLRGRFYDGGNFHAVGMLAVQESAPKIALNDMGQVAGQAVFGENVFHAFRWSRASGIADLGLLAGTDESLATDINNKGEVVGVARRLDQSVPARAVLWRPGARPIDLRVRGTVFPTLKNNDAGQVAGTTTGENGFEQAFSWTKSGGPLLLCGKGIRFSDARDINAKGQIAWPAGAARIHRLFMVAGLQSVRVCRRWAGAVRTQRPWHDRRREAGTQPRLCGPARGAVNLGTFAGGSYSIAWDVNLREQVVGEAGTLESAPSCGPGAAVWSTSIRGFTTGLLSLQLVSARQINDSGTIVAFTSNNILVLLVPVPVAASALYLQ
ncbi:hypothetical protein LP419_40590 [Massilia sp. H-1]|nr:hypothetical protein LP419_40590 [Massilia sp. H-1]